MTKKSIAGVVRFFKGFVASFVAGGITAMSVALSNGFSVSSALDIKNMENVLIMAFISGGLLAVQKMLAWKE